MPKLTRIHLNAGISQRVIQWLEANYPRTDVNWIAFGDYSYIETTLQGEELKAFQFKLLNRYPIETETIL